MRRWLSVAVAAGVVLLAGLWPAGPAIQAHTCAPEGDIDLDGALLIPSGSSLTRVTLADRRTRRLAVAAGGLVNHVARSRDGSNLAVARISQPEGDPVAGSDILITGPNGGQPALTIRRERAGDVLGAPAWLPDGGLLYHHQDIVGPSAGSRLERVDVDGGNRRTVLDGGAEPTVAPAGARFAFVQKRGADQLAVRDLDGDAETVLVDGSRFLQLAFPRFSPDGRWVAFAAVGGATGAALPGVARTPLARLWPAPAPVLAHGDPWDIWLVRDDGTGLRRLTEFFDDDPSPAWSPDGRWIAVYSGEALHIVEVDGTRNYCVLGSGGHGGSEWLE